MAKKLKDKFASGNVEDIENNDFKGMWEARYKKLIVIKSILNA